jgi:hypothetical protein
MHLEDGLYEFSSELILTVLAKHGWKFPYVITRLDLPHWTIEKKTLNKVTGWSYVQILLTSYIVNSGALHVCICHIRPSWPWKYTWCGNYSWTKRWETKYLWRLLLVTNIINSSRRQSDVLAVPRSSRECTGNVADKNSSFLIVPMNAARMHLSANKNVPPKSIINWIVIQFRVTFSVVPSKCLKFSYKNNSCNYERVVVSFTTLSLFQTVQCGSEMIGEQLITIWKEVVVV